MVKILVFGDSIAWGAFDLEKGGWVEKIKGELNKILEKNA
jgi:lysophospholipase L1-like esterase